jgi:hypothetical protein
MSESTMQMKLELKNKQLETELGNLRIKIERMEED